MSDEEDIVQRYEMLPVILLQYVNIYSNIDLIAKRIQH